jgi:hypothetical protein
MFVPREGAGYYWDRLRVLRNECALGLTHNRAQITELEQEHYRTTYSENVRHYLYMDKDGNFVAFSRLEWRDGYVYPTYGVGAHFRGRGYIWDVVRHAMLAAGGPLKGDLLVDNEAIKVVDYALGWRPFGDPVGLVQSVYAEWPPEFAKGVFPA